MFRSLHMKLVLIMLLLITSLMTVVGAFLMTSITDFYVDAFYQQMESVFGDSNPSNAAFVDSLRRQPALAGDVSEAVETLQDIVETRAGDLGIDSRTRNYYILDGATGQYLAGSDGQESFQRLQTTHNLLTARNSIASGSDLVGDASDITASYMDVAIPITAGDYSFIIYIYDNRDTVSELNGQLFLIIAQALLVGLLISVLLSFLLSKTMITPIERLTEGAERVAAGDFGSTIEVESTDEIGILTTTFNDMAAVLRDTLAAVENERNKLDTLFLHMTDGVVAFDRDTNAIKAIGEEARLMLGRTPGNIVAVRPLRQGVISDYTVTEKMIKYFVQKAMGRRTFKKPRISICVPSGVTEVERKAVEEATYAAGAREVLLIEEPVAAAIGAGIDISKPCGNMIVDIGGGTADIAVISLGGSVVSTSIKIAGDDFDEAIVRYMRKKHNLLIGERTAEDIKIKIGSCFPLAQAETMDVRGRNLVTGLPKTVTVSSEETEEALREPTLQIVEAVHSVLEKTPPELAADVADRGIVLTGGGALLRGLEELIEDRTGINTMTADEPMTCVAIGTGKFVEFLAGKRDED